MSALAPTLDTALARWRNNLIDLTRCNPLLSLRPGRSSFLEITAPDVTAVFERLVKHNKGWTFWLPPAQEEAAGADPAKKNQEKKEPAPPQAGELVTGETDRQRLLHVLTNLYRRAATDFRERGLRILHLAAGVLEWHDADDEPMRSPLVLVPLELKRKSLQEPFLLAALEEDPFLNPALEARLRQDFDFRLPAAPEDWEEKSLTAFLDEVEAAVQGLPGWKVERRALLSLFSFFKGVIFQDLQENADRAKAHPLVQMLAGLPVSFRKVELPSERELDDKQDPAQTYHILDADGSQRLCLEAAARQESFVLIGPPGTGKSQTIANLIADHLARGQRVLFVSEKMAALEVVFQRLRHVGLGDFCLELHSHKAGKRAVVTELDRCLKERPKPPDSGLGDGTAKLKERRDQLNRYVRALHTVREPMHRSAWDVLAELPRWNALGAIPLGLPLTRREGEASATSPPYQGGDKGGSEGLAVTDLSADQLDDLQRLLQRLQTLWHIRVDAHYPWKGFKADRFTLQLRDEVVALIDKARGRIDKLKVSAEQFANKIGVHGSPAWLLRVGDLLETRPGNVAASWLKAEDFAQFTADLDRCTDQYQRLGQARAPLTARYGPAVWILPEGTAAQVEAAWQGAGRFLAPGDDRGASLLAGQQKLRGWAADTLKKLPGWITEMRTLEKWLAVPLPLGAAAETRPANPAESRLDPSPQVVRLALRLANLCMSDNAPERPWVHKEETLQDAQNLIAVNKPVFASYHERRRRLLTIYNEQFFELELGRIAQGFAGPYLSWFRAFNGQFRRDRRAIARRSRSETMPATVAEDVALGRDLLVEKARLEGEKAQRQTLLGRYEKGLETDWEAADKAARVAVEALQIVHQLGSATMPGRLVDVLCATTPPQEKIRAAVKRLGDSFGSWQHATDELKALLPMDALPGASAPLDECAVSALLHFAKDLQAALNQLGGLTDPVLSRLPNPSSPPLAKGASEIPPPLAKGGPGGVDPGAGTPPNSPFVRGGEIEGGPPDLATFVADLHKADELRAFEATQETESPRWSGRLGTGFQGLATNWDALRKALTWTRRLRECFNDDSASGRHQPPGNFPRAGGLTTPAPPGLAVPPESFIALVTGPGPLPSVKDLKQALDQYEQALHLFEHRFDAPEPLLAGKPFLEHHPAAVLEHLTKLRDRAGELSDWIDFRHLPDRFAHLGLGAFWASLEQETLPREQVVDVFLKSFWSAWIEAVFQQDPVLGGFRRAEHERVLAEFRDLDRKMIHDGAARVTRQALSFTVAKEGPETSPLTKGGPGGISLDQEKTILAKEAHKKTKHRPLRWLFDNIPNLLLDVKPCLLMTPLSVSQFLPPDPGKMHFDLVVFDEASQILPEDALGAIYRGQQVVITGDNQQLPPTTFFQQMAGDDGDEPDEEDMPLFESILDASLGAGLQQKLLRWHYRSRHEHLIAFSNERYYEGRLVTFPSAWADHPDLGVKFHHVPDGVYDRGGGRDNLREAQVVADLVLDHFRKNPDKTLGVIAFSYPQMNAIEDEIDRRLRQEPDMERFFQGDRLEGFFVKNLETVQGDERDVILLSVGYGRDAKGKLAFNFGPLNREGGARRLNVAVTRARRKLILVSSIRARDLAGSPSDAVAHLHQYLDFAERGIQALHAGDPGPAGPPPHGLETEVMRELDKIGYKAVANVGCGINRIDLGVVDPKDPSRFVLGIEFDGPSYHQAATARDRDRLRPEILGQLGWTLHRIWSPDWLYRRQEEIERLGQALKAV